MQIAIIKRIALVVVVGLSLAFVPAMAVAQSQDEPLRLVYVDLSDGEGDTSKESLEKLLRQSSQIELMDEDQFLEVGESSELNRSLLSAGERQNHDEAIAAWMWKAEVEGILLHDLRDRGSTASVGVIGPHGWELADVERPLSGREFGQDEAMEVLEQVFVALVPEVRGFRRDVSEGRLTAQDFEMPDQVTDGSSTDLREQAVAEHRKTYGNLERQLDIRAGLLSGRRAMNMKEPNGGFALHHSTSLMGAVIKADFLIHTFERDTRAFEVGIIAGMAPFDTTFEDQDLSGRFIHAGVDGRYIYGVSDTLRLRAIGGLDVINLSIDPNQNYTGHGYFTGRFGGGVYYGFGSLMSVELDALFMPIVNGSNSGGAYGDVQGWFGYGGEAALHLELLDPFLMSLHYSFKAMNLDYLDVDRFGGATARSQDQIHHVLVTLGYRL